ELISDDEAYDTLAGFVFTQFGVVPQKGQKFDHKGYQFIVKEVIGRRINLVELIKERSVFEDV
ncbi:MAG: transporter associated domain-containing protein, partial [Candidatus Electryoneaceae bacterium]|nr:transporter associated domain-containing protein [Candidatus Electryoneaceae bacterium]